MPDLLLFCDDDGLGYSVHSRRDQYRAGTSVVKMTGFEAVNDAYISGIRAMSRVWAPHIQLKAGVPDDADQAKHPMPLDGMILDKVMGELEK